MFKDVAAELSHLKVNSQELRKFGITFFVVLGLIAGLLWWKQAPSFLNFGCEGYIYFGGASVLFLLLGLVLPKVLTPFFKVWMGLAFTLGWLMTRVILTILFFLVFTPIGFILKIMGKDILDLRYNKSPKSYWIKRDEKSFNPANCERLF